jgi:hypothetical protein
MGKLFRTIEFAVEFVRFVYEFVSTIHYSVELFEHFRLVEWFQHALMMIPHHLVIVINFF